LPGWSQFVDLIAAGLSFIANYTGSAGLAIIVFTILLRVVLLPLTVKSIRSASSMQILQPKIKELQKRYGDDKAKLQAEQMKLYQEHGINPLSGCLPMLLQIPIFFGLYFAILDLSNNGVGAWGNGFLWLPSLADADPWHILPIVAAVFQFLQARMTRPAGQGKPADAQQQMMYTATNFMPLMVVVFGWTFASGPVLYWAVSALFGVVQQWFITGWGSMREWFPFLPDLPEHRRLGYEHPSKRASRMAESQNNTGVFGYLNRQFAKQVERVEAGSQAQQKADTRSKSGGQTNSKSPSSTRGNSQLDSQTPSRNGRKSTDDAPSARRPDLAPRKARSSKRKRSIDSE
jgi:YidC/Oxa1 family membrane protein insertase